MKLFKSLLSKNKQNMFTVKFSHIGTFKVKWLEAGIHKVFFGVRHFSLKLDMGHCVYGRYQSNSYLWMANSPNKNKFRFLLNNEYRSAILYVKTSKKIIDIRPLYDTSKILPDNSIIGFEIFFDNEKVVLLKFENDALSLNKNILYSGLYFKDMMLEEVVNV